MKRSEMVKVLQEAFLYHMNPPHDMHSTDEEMYSAVLKALEDEGMSPPYIPSAGFDHFQECTRDHVADCEWEKE